MPQDAEVQKKTRREAGVAQLRAVRAGAGAVGAEWGRGWGRGEVSTEQGTPACVHRWKREGILSLEQREPTARSEEWCNWRIMTSRFWEAGVRLS